MLVVLTGLPCTGKSVVAAAVARELPSALFSADPIDAVLLRSGVTPEQRPDIIGYELMKALAKDHLSLGLSVVIDAVNPFEFVREAYARIALEQQSPMAVIATYCSDRPVHRERVERRRREGEKAIEWTGVERQRAYYEAPTGDVLVLDAVDPMADNINIALAYVAGFVEA